MQPRPMEPTARPWAPRVRAGSVMGVLLMDGTSRLDSYHAGRQPPHGRRETLHKPPAPSAGLETCADLIARTERRRDEPWEVKGSTKRRSCSMTPPSTDT